MAIFTFQVHTTVAGFTDAKFLLWWPVYYLSEVETIIFDAEGKYPRYEVNTCGRSIPAIAKQEHMRKVNSRYVKTKRVMCENPTNEAPLRNVKRMRRIIYGVTGLWSILSGLDPTKYL